MRMSTRSCLRPHATDGHPPAASPDDALTMAMSSFEAAGTSPTRVRRLVQRQRTTMATAKSSSAGAAPLCRAAIVSYRVVFRQVGALAATRLASPLRPWRGVITGFMVGPPTAARSLDPEVQEDGDAEEKRETLLHRDERHGTPPKTSHGRRLRVKVRAVPSRSRSRARVACEPPMDTTLSITDELNVAPARAKTLENA
jgi:hypothetical protein